MVKYLSGDFTAADFRDCGIGFTGSARGAIPNNNRAEAQGMPSGQRTKPMDPEITSGRGDGYAVEQREPMRKGGRIRRADGGKAMAEGSPIRVNPMTRNADPNMRTSPGPEVKEVNAHRGGRIRRAIGGVIPGEAPAPIDQPMTRPQTPQPAPQSPLAHATVTMPASDMSNLAAGAVKLGARTALAAAANRGKAALHPSMGPAGTAPAATPPMPASNTIPGGTRGGLHGGGRVRRAMGGPMPMPQQMPPGAMARPMPTAGGMPGVMPGMKEGGHFIQGAIKHPGRMKRGAAREGVSTHEYMEEHKDSPGSLGNAARLGLRMTGGDLSPDKKGRH
jgi:hypothetical protein